MIERENILSYLVTILKDVPGAKIVTRADQKVILDNAQQLPAIVIADLGSVVEDQNEASRDLWWITTVGIAAIVKASDEFSGASEIAAFETEIERVLYAQIWGCQDVGDLITLSVSPVIYPKTGTKIVVQGQRFKIRHYENIAALIA